LWKTWCFYCLNNEISVTKITYASSRCSKSEVLIAFDKVWNHLAEVNAAVGDDELAADIKAARQG